MNSFMGMPIVTNRLLTVPAEDWSRVRSPGRARRRMRRGFRQNIRYYDAPTPKAMVIGGVMYVHPDMLDAIMKQDDAVGSFV